MNSRDQELLELHRRIEAERLVTDERNHKAYSDIESELRDNIAASIGYPVADAFLWTLRRLARLDRRVRRWFR